MTGIRQWLAWQILQGIGLHLCFIGMQRSAGIVLMGGDDTTLVTLQGYILDAAGNCEPRSHYAFANDVNGHFWADDDCGVFTVPSAGSDAVWDHQDLREPWNNEGLTLENVLPRWVQRLYCAARGLPYMKRRGVSVTQIKF
ncbi:hypothetical protein MVEG_11619 [Podila verticillata NRRL 6337]|uniref:Uncharacterized protein n=1 Tax=Podila verticillata NRRL 6337 TaxID=1069443 RepID=A0A086TKD3_9FUNG|nr:hypothetical protein MVEG_11619 [Podila verticillata NRRL 6337]